MPQRARREKLFYFALVPAIVAGVAVVGIVIFTVFNLYVLYTSAGGGSYRERIDAAKENNRELEAEIQRLEREIRDINVSKLSSQTEFANDLIRKRNRNLSLMLDRLEEVVGDKEVRIRSVTTRIEEETVHLRLNVEDEDDEALLLPVDVVAQDRWTADPFPLAPGGTHLVRGPLRDDLAFELREGQKHVEHQPSHRGAGIESLRNGDEGDLVPVEHLHQLGEVEQ